MDLTNIRTFNNINYIFKKLYGKNDDRGKFLSYKGKTVISLTIIHALGLFWRNMSTQLFFAHND